MNNSYARTKCNGGLPEPPLKWRAGGFVYHDSGRERLRSKWKIIADAHGTADVFNVASESARGHIKGVNDQKPARVYVWTLSHIKCVA